MSRYSAALRAAASHARVLSRRRQVPPPPRIASFRLIAWWGRSTGPREDRRGESRPPPPGAETPSATGAHFDAPVSTGPVGWASPTDEGLRCPRPMPDPHGTDALDADDNDGAQDAARRGAAETPPGRNARSRARAMIRESGRAERAGPSRSGGSWPPGRSSGPRDAALLPPPHERVRNPEPHRPADFHAGMHSAQFNP